jgi:hypothetical protein
LSRGSALLVDVRAPPDYKNGFIEDSVNFPLYRSIEGWGFAKNIRRAAFAFFGSMGSGEDFLSYFLYKNRYRPSL